MKNKWITTKSNLKVISILFLLIPSISLAQVSSVSPGGVIEASKMNELIQKINQLELNQKNQIGVIQQALLTQAEFQALNGDCWVAMNGQSIALSDYAVLTGRNTLPNTAGKFLRSTGGNAEALGVHQGDAIRNITGRFTAGRAIAQPTDGAFFQSTFQGSGPNNGGSSEVGMTFDASRVVPTALENRPTNIAVNFFIKINKQCNFNQ